MVQWRQKQNMVNHTILLCCQHICLPHASQCLNTILARKTEICSAEFKEQQEKEERSCNTTSQIFVHGSLIIRTYKKGVLRVIIHQIYINNQVCLLPLAMPSAVPGNRLHWEGQGNRNLTNWKRKDKARNRHSSFQNCNSTGYETCSYPKSITFWYIYIANIYVHRCS